MKRTTRWIIATVTLVIIGLLATIGYLLWLKPNNNQPAITSFESCAAAGNQVTESYPRQCRDTASGTTFTEATLTTSESEPEQLATRTYTSAKGVQIEIDQWADNKRVTSPLTITGRVPGNWSFEANFPVELTSTNGQVIAKTPATLQGDWMTDELVLFTITLEFDASKSGSDGLLRLQKSNPSDLTENNDLVELPVRF